MWVRKQVGGWCFPIKAGKSQALHGNGVITTRCHPLVTGWKRSHLTAAGWEPSSTSGKNPGKINLRLRSYNGRFCCTNTSINILAQSNVKLFISRDKNLLTPKEHFPSCDTHPKDCLQSGLSWNKNIQMGGEQHILTDVFSQFLCL